jgi:L-lactate utilization protein LutB
MNFLKEAYKVKAETIIKNLEKRNMQGFYVDTKEEALDKFMTLINAGDVVAWGGSTTVDEIGVKKLLDEKNISVIDRDKAKSPEERTQLMKKALTADVFITSTNAITMDGELMNVDGVGNRLAAYNYGPDSVIVFAGMNKVVPEMSVALARVRSEATVPNSIRVNAQSPCRFTGKCSECIGINSLCCQILITRCSKPQNRIKIILIGESLGF